VTVVPARPTRGWPPSRVLVAALALGLVGLGIGYGVYRSRGPAQPPEPDAGPAVVQPPGSLGGLGFLPADANVVFAVQPGPVLTYADRTKHDPRDLLAKAGVPASVFATLDRLGIPLDQIDHVVAGAHVPDADLGELRVALALVLRNPVADEPRFLDQLKAKRTVRDGKTHYDVEFAGVPLKLARASAATWVFGWADRDLGPALGGVPRTHLSTELTETLAQKLPPDAAAWVATDSARWGEKKAVQLLLGQAGKKEWLPALAKGQAAVVGLSVADPPRLRVFVRAADADTGERLRAYFAKKATGDGVRTGGAGEWAMLDAPADPRDGFATLKDFLADAGK
jgi:hypothetical protein